MMDAGARPGDRCSDEETRPVVSPEACPALVLNADFRPLSYYPLSLWSWQDAVKAVFMDRVQTLSEYDRVVRSPTSRPSTRRSS